MIFGRPYDFAISYDESYILSDNPSLKLGVFNFIINDQFVPAQQSNFTLDMVINHLKYDLEKIKDCQVIADEIINDEAFYYDLMCTYHPYLTIADFRHGKIGFDDLPDELGLQFNNLKNNTVELTPVEFDDLGVYVFYAKSATSDYLFYSYAYGENIIRTELPSGTVAAVIDSIYWQGNTVIEPNNYDEILPMAAREPDNSLELFEKSIVTNRSEVRLSIDDKGNIHRFFCLSKNGKDMYHWTGSEGNMTMPLQERQLDQFSKEIKQLRRQE